MQYSKEIEVAENIQKTTVFRNDNLRSDVTKYLSDKSFTAERVLNDQDQRLPVIK